jgi:hypothetical protein
LRRRNDVARDADDEQIAEALIENNFRRHTRVRAAEDDRERFLPLRELVAPRGADARIALALGHEAPIALAQQVERFPRRNHPHLPNALTALGAHFNTGRRGGGTLLRGLRDERGQ